MTEGSQPYNLRAIREVLQTAFTVEELRGLFSFAVCHEIRPVVELFMPEDSKPAAVAPHTTVSVRATLGSPGGRGFAARPSPWDLNIRTGRILYKRLVCCLPF